MLDRKNVGIELEAQNSSSYQLITEQLENQDNNNCQKRAKDTVLFLFKGVEILLRATAIGVRNGVIAGLIVAIPVFFPTFISASRCFRGAGDYEDGLSQSEWQEAEICYENKMKKAGWAGLSAMGLTFIGSAGDAIVKGCKEGPESIPVFRLPSCPNFS